MKHICRRCIENPDLKDVIRREGQSVVCGCCGEDDEPAITISRLSDVIDPVFKVMYDFGDEVPTSDGRMAQEGFDLSTTLQILLAQVLDCEAELIAKLKERHNSRAPDGEPPYYDDERHYVIQEDNGYYLASAIVDWGKTLRELKHSRRFFSPSATKLFSKLFAGVDGLTAMYQGNLVPVSRTVAAGTSLYRARSCRNKGEIKKFSNDPLKHLGPPPSHLARNGRMNAEGVAVLYCATNIETCLAEMRPAIGMQMAVAEFETISDLRILDFERLEWAQVPNKLGPFHPRYAEEKDRAVLLGHLHTLITRPVTPGRETNYLITQTMAEYLAHVHEPPFDGVAFSSAQREGGTNIVLFPRSESQADNIAAQFPIQFNAEKGRVTAYNTKAIEYRHEVDSSSVYWPLNNSNEDMPF
jgi:hypothetical protein